MKPLPPIPVPWTMKPLSSAETKVEELPGGRLRFSIRHDVLRGVTPAMLVWWLNHMEGTVEIAGQAVPRYRAWHPRDHVALTYVRPAVDGRRFGTGAQVRIQECFGARPEHSIDVVSTIDFLDETGFRHGEWRLGIRVGVLDYKFTPVPGGTLYEDSLTLGTELPGARTLVNRLLLPLEFSVEKGRAWMLHNVEEVGNLEQFLPELYAREGGR